MREQVGWDVFEVGRDQLRRAAPALRRGNERRSARCGRLDQGLQFPLRMQQILVGHVSGRPAAGRRERDDACRPASRCELKRDVAAERVADEMRELKTRRVHRAFHSINERVRADRSVNRLASCVAGQRQCKYVVLALQHRQHELPGPPRVHEAVQT